MIEFAFSARSIPWPKHYNAIKRLCAVRSGIQVAKTVSEEETQLRKRARRRLVGSITLVIAAVVILPMVLDSKPEQRIEEIDIRIPSEDAVDELGPESEASGGSPGKVTPDTDVSGIQGANEAPNQAQALRNPPASPRPSRRGLSKSRIPPALGILDRG